MHRQLYRDWFNFLISKKNFGEVLVFEWIFPFPSECCFLICLQADTVRLCLVELEELEGDSVEGFVAVMPF